MKSILYICIAFFTITSTSQSKYEDGMKKAFGFWGEGKMVEASNLFEGMKYAGKVTTLYQEALALAPENPVVVFSKAEWDAGSAKYFGQSMEPFCKDVQKAIDLSADFKEEGQFYPKFQKDRAQEFIDTNCKE